MDLLLKERLKASYNDKAEARDKMEIEDWKKAELDSFLKHIHLFGKTVLDLGAGTGQHGKYMFDNGLDVTCIDLSPNMVELCREKGLRAEVMDYYSLKYETGSFDGVWAMNTLLHTPKDSLPAVLANIHRVLKENGLFYMGVYGGKDSEDVWEDDPYIPKRFFSFYTDEGIQEAVLPLFDIIDFHVIPGAVGNLDFQSLLLRKKHSAGKSYSKAAGS
jgi:SAM-dependent methyltransferase